MDFMTLWHKLLQWARPAPRVADCGRFASLVVKGQFKNGDWAYEFRYHPAGGGPGSEYTFSCNVIQHPDRSIDFSMGSMNSGQQFDAKLWRAIRRAMKQIKGTRGAFYRHKEHGRSHTIIAGPFDEDTHGQAG